MKTITVDIINEKAIKLLLELETLKLIRLRKEGTQSNTGMDVKKSHKGLMKKQPQIEIDSQLNSLRSEWE